MPDFRLRGRRISYLDTDAGASSAASAQGVLLLLHAFPLTSTMWEEQLAGVPTGWRAIAPDYAGFGGSELWADDDATSTIEEYARDMVALLDHLDIRQVVVVGLSMGGYVAFAVWRLAAARIAGLVLADTKAEADSEEARTGRLQMVTLVERRGVDAVVDQMVPHLLSERARRERPDLEARVRAAALANTADGVRRALVAMMGRPDSTPLLRDIRCPALVIVGSDDEVTPEASARVMHRQMAAADLVVVPDAGHLSNMERPAAFNEAVGRFLRKLANVHS